MGIPRYWTENDIKALSKATEYGDLFPICQRVLGRIPRPRVQLCGPISTGGKGSIEENVAKFRESIAKVMDTGKEVFDQTPMEDHIQRIKNAKGEDYPVDLLNDVFLPIFTEGLVDELVFIPTWETSRGSRWEHQDGEKLGIKITYLDEKAVQ